MPPKTPVVINRSPSAVEPKPNYGTSAKTRYSSLPPQEQADNIAREEAEFKQVQAFAHERLAPNISELTELTWAAFYVADKNYLEVQGGRQSTLSRILPGATARLNMKLSARFKRKVNVLAEYTETQILELLPTIYLDNLTFDKLKEEVSKIRMTCKEFSMPAFDSLSGKFFTLTELTYLSVWQKTPLKAQSKLFVSALAPPHLCLSVTDKLEQETYANFYEAFSIISNAAAAEVDRLLNNQLAKASIPDKSSLPPPKSLDSSKAPSADADSYLSDPIRANLIKSGEEPCPNCQLFGIDKRFIKHTLMDCRMACACGTDPAHVAVSKGVIQCNYWKPPKKVKKVEIIHEEDMEDDETTAQRVHANRTQQVNSVTMSHYNPLGIINESEMADLDDPPSHRASRVRLQDSPAQTSTDNARNIYSQFSDRELDDFFSEEYGYAPGERIVIAHPDTILQALTARRVTTQLSNED